LNFYPANYLKSFYWIGLTGSFIKYDRNKKEWLLFQTASKAYATSDASDASLLMGNVPTPI
jgi:hypothetical protein